MEYSVTTSYLLKKIKVIVKPPLCLRPTNSTDPIIKIIRKQSDLKSEVARNMLYCTIYYGFQHSRGAY